jgi:hypothetical protein
LALVLKDRRLAAPAQEIELVDAVAAPDGPPSVTDQAFALAASAIGKIPTKPVPADVTEQLKRLASLREPGILAEEEFDAKRKELLARLWRESSGIRTEDVYRVGSLFG